MSDNLDQVVAEYRDKHGEPEYRYFKMSHTWVKHGRKPGSHFVSVADKGTTVSKEEYDANIDESKRLRSEAFIGKLPRTYWEYRREVVKDGWHEALTKDVKALDH